MHNQFDWAAKWNLYSPDKVAFKEFESGKELSFSVLHSHGTRLARYWKSIGLKKGDRIAIISENCIEYMVMFAAAQKTGCILVPLNYRLAMSEIDFLIQDSSPAILYYGHCFVEKGMVPGFDSSGPKTMPLSKMLEDLDNAPSLEMDEIDLAEISEDDPIFILYTSGTTGFPKGALYTHKMLYWNSINTSLSLILNTESRTINFMPPFHTGGWNVLTTPFLHHGGYTCHMKNFDASRVLKAIREERPSILMAVPTMLNLLADHPEFEDTDLSSLLYIIVGGAPMPHALIEIWHERGVPIRQGYGMTEVGPNLTSLHQDDAIRKMGSIGRPNFYVESRIVDASGELCRVGQAGEMQLKGPVVTPGYWQNPDSTDKAFEEGWFKTGDQVVRDEEGYLFVVDRIKNMFISGGENVYPAEVERIMLQMDGVGEVAVVGVSDAKWGEVGHAFVVAQRHMTAEEVKIFCTSNMAKFKVPKHIEFVDALPKNDTGKINRKRLQEWTL